MQEKGSRYIQEIAKQHPKLEQILPHSPKQSKSQKLLSSSSQPKESSNYLSLHSSQQCPMKGRDVRSDLQKNTTFYSSTRANDFSPKSNPISIIQQKSYENLSVIHTKLRILRDEQNCKVCLNNLSDCLFLPCRHICSCIECAQALRSCPICRKKLEKIIKIYRQ